MANWEVATAAAVGCSPSDAVRDDQLTLSDLRRISPRELWLGDGARAAALASELAASPAALEGVERVIVCSSDPVAAIKMIVSLRRVIAVERRSSPQELDRSMKELGKLLVIDVEATCWDGKPPAGEQSEIIEIGLCTVDIKTLSKLEKLSIIVKPRASRVSEFCTELTGLTQQRVDSEGISIERACDELERLHGSKRHAWASYGDYDRTQFQRQLGPGYPFGPRHVNVKTMLASALGLPAEVGLDEAMRLLQLPLEGRHHSGADDAWNVATLWIAMMRGLREWSTPKLVKRDERHVLTSANGQVKRGR